MMVDWYCTLIVNLSIITVSNIIMLAETRPDTNPYKDMDDQSSKLCQPDRLTVYRVTLKTFWNYRNFPKHYPQWRPPAQWSKLIGRSHNKSYILYRLDQKASEGLKMFAENGRSDSLDTQSQGEGGIYDEFNAPPILSGEGRTEAEFFVDGNHSRVSLISKLIPSPDWFIGIDSLDLCVESKWLDSITIEVDVIDAGTDNGFAFTSPNWPTEPQEKIRRMTNSNPNHPASSFFYPGVRKLPVIASFQFVKAKEYELTKIFHQNDGAATNELNMEQVSYIYEEGEDALVLQRNATNHDETQNSNNKTNAMNQFIGSNNTNSSVIAGLEKQKIIFSLNHHVENTALGKRNYTSEGTQNQHPLHNFNQITKISKGKIRKQKGLMRNRPPRDCEVGKWSDWSPCSKTCEIGESTRFRKVLNHARRGGQPCPYLFEKKWCGSARSCNRSYFNWS